MSALDGLDLIGALLALQRDKAWGTIDVEAGSSRTCIYVADGKPVFAEEGTLADTLGRFLQREGVLSPTQYATILARMTERLVESEPMRFGEVAVALGYLTVQQVHDALAAQIQQKVIRCLGQTQATFVFRASRDWVREVGRFPSDVEPLVLHAAGTFEEERVEALLRAEEPAFARLVGDPEAIAATFHLGAGEARWLAKLDGAHSTHDLLASTEVDASAILTALLLCGHLALEGRPRAATEPPPSRAARPTTATRRRLMAQAARISTSKLQAQQEPTAESRAQAEATLRQLWESRRPRTPSVPTPKSPQEARLLAEAAFQVGLGHLRGGSHGKAAQELRHAADLLPTANEYALYAQWAEFARDQATLDETQRRKALKALETGATALLAQVADLGFAFYVLGQVQLLGGHDELARRLFRRAHRLDPDLTDAERHVRLLELRKRRSAPGDVEGGAAEAKGPLKAIAKIALKAVVVPVAEAPTAGTVMASSPTASTSTSATATATATATSPSLAASLRDAELGASPPTPTPTTEPAPDVPAVPSAVVVAPARRSRIGWLLGAGLLLIGLAVTLVFVLPLRPRPTALPVATVHAPPRAVSAAPSVSAVPSASASAVPSASASSASAIPSASASAGAPSGDSGELSTGPGGKGHRLFLDGRSLGDGPGPYRVPCGAHTLRIGSHGKEQPIDVPCGGELRVD